MSLYDAILSNVEEVLQSLMERQNPDDYTNIAKLIEILETIRG